MTSTIVQCNTSANQLLQYIKKCLDEVFGKYKHGGFEITEVHCDKEFHNVIYNYSINQYPPIHMNYAAAKAHAPHAKRNNCTIQEHVKRHIMDCLTIIYHAFCLSTW